MATIEQVLQQGWQLHQSGMIDQAMQLYRHVLAQVPRSPEAHVYLGIAQFDQRQFTESVESYRRALAIRDHFPIAWNNLGNSYRLLGRVDDAEECFRKALDQQPDYGSAFKNRGTLWIWAGEVERGLQWYEAGLKVDPNDAELHRNRGVIHLLMGNFEIGWPEYRWRWRMPGMIRPQVIAPFWQGEPLAAKTVLLYPEQGLGDLIHFARMATMLHDEGAHVILQVAPEMMPLLSSLRGVAQWLPTGAVVPPIDYHLSLVDAVDVWYWCHGSLPWGLETTDRYLDVADHLVDHWRGWFAQRLPQTATKPLRVGISWQGNPEFRADVYRSFPVETLRSLAKLPDVSLVSLQFGYGAESLESCDFADQVQQLPEGIDRSNGAFVDTAAILKNLDMVVTCDTAVGHLAGALGVPVQVMLGKVPDWRWGMQGETTRWYPTMRLVRQRKLGDWSDVVPQVIASLPTR